MTNQKDLSCDSYQEWSRRSLLKGATTGAISMLFGPSALAKIALNEKETHRDSLIVVFLRGGADGLNVVAPYGEDAYHRIRPTIALKAPNKGLKSERALDIDGFFGLHPAMSPIESILKDGKLSVVHAAGSNDQSRSHFEAMAAMERGLGEMNSGAYRANGWLARYLNATVGERESPIRALAISDMMPDSLRGAPGALNISEIGQYRLKGPADFHQALTKAYAGGNDEMTYSGRETLKLLNTLDRLDYKAYKPANGVSYPDTALGQGMRQVSFLLKASVGLEVAVLDQGGYDTHVVQGGSTGWLAGLLGDLAQSMRAISDDLGEKMSKTTVVVMTEFGRRAYENGGLGTDHGRASFMMTMGGGTKGGKVYGDWPGLEKNQLAGPGDLKVTTDYRAVLEEVLVKKMGLTEPERVFKDSKRNYLGIFG